MTLLSESKSPRVASNKRPLQDGTNLSSCLRPSLKRRRTTSTLTPLPAPSVDDEYDFDTVKAIRANDVDTLRSLLKKGKSFAACNSNGESFLHLACRRAKLTTVNFLLNEARAKVDVKDSMGRTVLFDLFWRPKPEPEMLASVMKLAPLDLLLVKDARGHSCFDYTRKEHVGQWVSFLSHHPLQTKTGSVCAVH